MKYRKLGNTGYDVGVIGFGTWQLGGKRWVAPDDESCIRLLQESREAGVNLFDAAVVYGQYADEKGYSQSRSQELLGKAFANKRDSVIYCVKLGQFDEYSHRSDFSAPRIAEQIKQSMRRLSTDYIDIALIHAPSLHEVQAGKALGVLQTLQALGIVRSIGYSFENQPQHVASALEQPIGCVMLQLNLLDQECVAVTKEAERRGIGVLAGGPLKRGYLTGKFRTIFDLPIRDDYWRWNLALNPGKVEELLTKVSELLMAYGTPRALRKKALQFVLEQSGIGSAVVGHRTIEEVRENIESISDPIENGRIQKSVGALSAIESVNEFIHG